MTALVQDLGEKLGAEDLDLGVTEWSGIRSSGDIVSIEEKRVPGSIWGVHQLLSQRRWTQQGKWRRRGLKQESVVFRSLEKEVFPRGEISRPRAESN